MGIFKHFPFGLDCLFCFLNGGKLNWEHNLKYITLNIKWKKNPDLTLFLCHFMKHSIVAVHLNTEPSKAFKVSIIIPELA